MVSRGRGVRGTRARGSRGRGGGGRRGRGARGGRGGRTAVPATAFSLSDEDRATGWEEVSPEEINGDGVKEKDVPFNFTVRAPGAKSIPQGTMTPLQYFMLFFTRELFLIIVKETNK